jgi:hypothetical protein
MVLEGLDSFGVEEHSTLVAVSEKSPQLRTMNTLGQRYM